MKTYRMEVSIDDGKWRDGGTIEGRSPKATLKRAWYQHFTGFLDTRKIIGTTVFHAKYTDLPVFRIVEVQ